MKVYLAGYVRKGREEWATLSDWREECIETLQHVPNLQFINPEHACHTVSDAEFALVFGYCCHTIKHCDIMLVDASIQLGVGTSQEMMIARYFRKPVITVLPKDTFHRRPNLWMPRSGVIADWIHPFVYMTSNAIVETFEEAALWLQRYQETPVGYSTSGMGIIDESIDAFMRVETYGTR